VHHYGVSTNLQQMMTFLQQKTATNRLRVKFVIKNINTDRNYGDIKNVLITIIHLLFKIKIIIQLLKQNAKLMEILENGTHNTTNTTHTNSHNNAFNLQFFLNETCKHAMNITDFVDSIKVQLSDFMSMGEVGFVEGISNIIVKNLTSLDETIRPIHCTDQKRETFYVKDQNTWEKEDNEKKKLKNMIKSISYKNEKLIKTYKEMYPDYNDSYSHRSDHYSTIMVEAMDCKQENREKIIKNISKVTVIKTK
jgi:Txe/YoeB family toxin of Txe-Axe toxin-antitoxin module